MEGRPRIEGSLRLEKLILFGLKIGLLPLKTRHVTAMSQSLVLVKSIHCILRFFQHLWFVSFFGRRPKPQHPTVSSEVSCSSSLAFGSASIDERTGPPFSSLFFSFLAHHFQNFIRSAQVLTHCGLQSRLCCILPPSLSTPAPSDTI